MSVTSFLLLSVVSTGSRHVPMEICFLEIPPERRCGQRARAAQGPREHNSSIREIEAPDVAMQIGTTTREPAAGISDERGA